MAAVQAPYRQPLQSGVLFYPLCYSLAGMFTDPRNAGGSGRLFYS